MDGGEKTLIDAERLVKNLCNWCETVGGTASVRNDVVLCRIVLILVDAENDGDVFVLGGSRDDDLLHAVVAVVDSESSVGEESGGFDDDIDASRVPRNVRWISLSKNCDWLSVDDNVLFVGRYGAVKVAVRTVVFQQMGICSGIRQIVDGNNFDVVSMTLKDSSKRETTDSSKAVNSDAHWHTCEFTQTNYQPS